MVASSRSTRPPRTHLSIAGWRITTVLAVWQAVHLPAQATRAPTKTPNPGTNSDNQLHLASKFGNDPRPCGLDGGLLFTGDMVVLFKAVSLRHRYFPILTTIIIVYYLSDSEVIG
jgi:hypothetical protein